jgi:hypothetical protein
MPRFEAIVRYAIYVEARFEYKAHDEYAEDMGAALAEEFGNQMSAYIPTDRFKKAKITPLC